MSEILFLADAHAQKGAWANYPIYGDAMWGLRQAQAVALRRKVEAVVLGGDLSDRQTNRAAVPVALYKFVSGLSEAGVAVYDVQGQHDLDDPRWLSATASVHLDRFLATLPCGLKLYGLDWRPADKLAEELERIPDGADVLVAHQVWAEWMGAVTAPEGRLADVPRVRAVWTGDLHGLKRTQVRVFPDGPLCAVSPGALCKQEIDEPDEHFVLVYDTAQPLHAAAGYKAVKLRSRPVVRVDAVEAAAAGVDDAVVAEELCKLVAAADVKGLPEELHAPLVRLTYPAARNGLPRLAREALLRAGLAAHLFPKPVDLAAGVAADGPPAPATAREALPAFVDPHKRPAAYALGEALLRGGDRYAAIIDDWCESFEQPS